MKKKIGYGLIFEANLNSVGLVVLLRSFLCAKINMLGYMTCLDCNFGLVYKGLSLNFCFLQVVVVEMNISKNKD